MKNRRRIIFILLSQCVAVLLGLTCSPALASPACSLTMGWEPWPPYMYRDKNDRLTGLDIEIINAIMQQMECKLEFREVPWARLIKQVELGDTNIAGGASWLRERTDWAYYSKPYRTSDLAMFVLKGKSGKYPFNSLADISGTDFSLGIVRGAWYGEEFEQLKENPEFQQHLEVSLKELNILKMLLAKRIDGFLIDKKAGLELLRQQEAGELVEIHPLHILREELHILFSKQSTTPALVEQFDENLDELKASGEYQKIYSKSFK